MSTDPDARQRLEIAFDMAREIITLTDEKARLVTALRLALPWVEVMADRGNPPPRRAHAKRDLDTIRSALAELEAQP